MLGRICQSRAFLQAQSEDQKHQIDALTAQLEHLTASKAHLESRCHLLEKVVKMREAPIDANPQARISSPIVATCSALSCYAQVSPSNSVLCTDCQAVVLPILPVLPVHRACGLL